MSISEEQELLISQFVDHELLPEQANQLLGSILDELGEVKTKSEACHMLRSMLKLQGALFPWRGQTPPRQTVVVAPAQRAGQASPSLGRLMGLATAALLGGVLVTGGFFLGGRWNNTGDGAAVTRNNSGQAAALKNAEGSSRVTVVTPEHRREIARAFALHESVAGPLSWYAADDATIQVAPAEKSENLQPPVAVVLRLTPDKSSKNTAGKTFVIVCRDYDSATIKLPRAIFASDVRLQLTSKATDQGVNLQYVVVADDSSSAGNDAALVGHRQLDLKETSLGQLALNDRLVSVDASAWIMRDQ